jgi:branched-chain amino acid aminotransferase
MISIMVNNSLESAMCIYPVWFNDRLFAGEQFLVSGYHSGLLHGFGVFTTIKIEQGRPLWATSHYQRLQQQAAKIGLISKWESATLAAGLAQLLDETNLTVGKARITLLAKNSRLWPQIARVADHISPINANPINSAPPADISEPQCQHRLLAGDSDCLITIAPIASLNRELRLTGSSYRFHSQAPTAGIKTLNYVDNLLIVNEAQAAGYDAAVILNEQHHIVSSALANIFWITIDGQLCTPAQTTGCLNGITRQVIIYLAQRLAIPCQEVSMPLRALDEAIGIFLTSSVQGLQPVTTWQQRHLATTQLPLWQQLQREYQHLLASDPDSRLIFPPQSGLIR